MPFDLSSPSFGIAAQAKIGIIYGQSGIGKTTFTSLFPNTLIIDIENGIPERLRQIPRFSPKSTRDVYELFDALRVQPHNYLNIAVDSITAFGDHLVTEICREQNWLMPDGRNNMGEKGYGAFGRGEKIFAERMSVFMSKVHALRDERNVGVTLIGHVRQAKINPPDGDPYTRYDLAFPQLAAEVVTQRADFVGFITYPMLILKDDKAQTGKANITGDARIYLTAKASHHAKNRMDMPESIIIPAGNPLAGYGEFARYIPYLAQYLQQSAQSPAAAMPQ